MCHDDEKKWFAVLSLLYRVPALPSEDDRNVTSRLQSSTFARASAIFSTTFTAEERDIAGRLFKAVVVALWTKGHLDESTSFKIF